MANIAELIKETHHRDWKQRLNAARQLGEMGDTALIATQDLVQLLNDKNETVQGTAIVAIRKIQPDSQNVVQPLIKLLLGESESLSKISGYAINKLVSGNKHIIPALITALHESPLFIRCRIISLLGKIGPLANDAFPDLFEIVQKDLTEDFTFTYALDAMIDIGFPKKSDLNRIFHLLKTRTGTLRLFALPDYDEKNTIIINHVLPLFEELAEKYYYLHYQMITLIASSHIGSIEFILPLIQCLAHPDQAVRRYAAECFAFIGPPAYEAVSPLVWALKDKHHEVRFYAAEALGYIGATAYHAIPALTETSHDPDSAVRESAKEAIDKIHAHTIN